MAITETPVRYADALTHRVTAGNAIGYADRELGEGDVPLVLMQHYRGNLDNWDPALVDALAAGASPTTRCCSESPPSSCRCSSPTATAIR